MTTLNLQVAADADDGYWDDAGTIFFAGSGIVNIGDTGQAGRESGFCRFTNVTIPPGSTVSAADLKLQGGGIYNGDNVTATIRAVLQANATAPTSSGDAKGRTRTTAGVATGNFPHYVNGTVFTSANIASVIQEVINQGGWASGNAIVVYIVDAGSSVNAGRGNYGHQSSSSKCPILDITYSTPAFTSKTQTVDAAITPRLNKALTWDASLTAVTPKVQTFDACLVAHGAASQTWGAVLDNRAYPIDAARGPGGAARTAAVGPGGFASTGAGPNGSARITK